jgi:hypothetical protein
MATDFTNFSLVRLAGGRSLQLAFTDAGVDVLFACLAIYMGCAKSLKKLQSILMIGTYKYFYNR